MIENDVKDNWTAGVFYDVAFEFLTPIRGRRYSRLTMGGFACDPLSREEYPAEKRRFESHHEAKRPEAKRLF
jgi:hypothetical protein